MSERKKQNEGGVTAGWLRRNAKVIGTVLAVALGGGGVAIHQASADDSAEPATKQDVQELRTRLEEHAELPSHREGGVVLQELRSRLERVETKIDRLLERGRGR